ncbi:MAG: cytochrome c oxidase subunit I [Acidimicrobiales bacterium]
MSEATTVRTREEARRDLHRAWASQRGIPGFFSAVNHKQIGMRFIWTAVAFLVVGGIEGLLIRVQLATSENTFLGPEAYNQVFTMHGTTMMFLFAVPVLEGLAMYLAPLQIGTRDMPFPRLNAFGYWIYLAGGLLLNWSLLTGSIPDGGWFAYTPLSGLGFSPDRGLDFWLLGVTFVEIAGIIGAIELITVILRFRAPGMTLGRMPLFSWSVLVMASMMLIAFPFVIAASTMLELERKVGAPFYDPALGGNPLLWQHLFWIFGHPEVYIILLPAIGMVSAVVAVHVQRPVVAYPLMVASSIAIGVVSFGLWVHHMFAVGLPIMVLSLFAIASYFIAIPSGIQVFAWIATIWEGRPRWRTPMWFVVGFLVIFVLGGVTGVMVATAPFDLQAHDSFFVVAHLHYVLIGGGVFPLFAGLHHWFPKMTGRLPSEAGGKTAFWLMFVGFNVTFFPQHWLGLQGMARRVYTYDATLGWDTTNMISTVGAFVLAAGFAVFLGNLAWAWRNGTPTGGDPWDGDSLEWATSSPPAAYNFEQMPTVGGPNPLWDDTPADLSPAAAQAVLSLSRPLDGRREVLRTSVLDARPEAIVSLPGPSYWPLLTAVALTVSIIGVLVDWWVLAGAAGIATVACVVLWNLSNRRSSTAYPEHDLLVDDAADDDEMRVLARARTEAHRVFAAEGASGRNVVWWAMVIALVGLGTIASAFVYSYFYLRLGADQWPLPGTPLRTWQAPALALGLAIGAGVTAAGTLPARGRLAASWSLGAGAVLVQLWSLIDSGYAIDANAYEALVVTLEAVSALLLAAAIGLRTFAVRFWTPDARPGGLHDADAALWKGALWIWIAVWGVVHLAPRII